MYSPRRRKYYSKKYYRNRLFAPSLAKANMPNYYQMKGRIIQQSPARIKEPTTQLMTREILDKYYQKLLEYKYPFPSTPPPIPPPPFDYDSYLYNFRTNSIGFDFLPATINLNYLYSNFVSSILPTLPDTPTGYEYGFRLISIQFNWPGVSNMDYSNISFSWSSSLTVQPIALLIKSVNSSIPDTFQAEIFATPSIQNTMRVSQIAFTQSTINYRFTVFSTTDEIQTDNALYPLISTESGSETHDASIAISKSGTSSLAIRFNIQIFLSETI